MKRLSYLVKHLIIGIPIFWIDLFSGAGGTTTGIEKAQTGAIVVACVNHDVMAIASHAENHPNCIHFVEDIRDFNVVIKLKEIVDFLRKEYPGCVINLHASLECTNYSKAKGGQPRDADSRTLAEHLYMYIEQLSPDFIFIENVREFMAWGPLDENGKPVSRKQGIDYIRWKQTIQSYGYNFDYRILNSADFGGCQTRERYFGQFAKKGFPISWPNPTHSKNPIVNEVADLFSDNNQSLKKWRAVREVLRLDLEGESIFTRKKPLVEATLKRIYAGLEKFVAKGEPTFIKRYNGGNPAEKVRSTYSPIGTISTNGRHAFVSANFLCSYYGNGNCHSIDQPVGTITTKDRYSLIFPFIDEQYGTGTAKSINNPVGTITAVPKQSLVHVSKSYLMNPQFSSKGGDINNPCFTLIARMDKMPPYLITSNQSISSPEITLLESDSETMKCIKTFMINHNIYDIKMRMLLEEELLQIQGFPKEYKLKGTSAQRKKQIGNAVHTDVQKAITQANYNAINYQ